MKPTLLKHDDLLEEKSLWQIYRKSWSIPDGKFNWAVGMCSLLFFSAYAATANDVHAVHQILLKLAEMGFNASVSLLGFLIAGFTIFASLTNPELLLKMLKHKHNKSGLSYLKYNFFTLIRTFIYFLVFAAFQLGVIAIGQKGGPISVIVNWYPDLRNWVSPAVRLTFVASAVLWTAIFLELKSFVFNIHHIVFTMIKFDAVDHNEKTLKGRAEISGNDE